MSLRQFLMWEWWTENEFQEQEGQLRSLQFSRSSLWINWWSYFLMISSNRNMLLPIKEKWEWNRLMDMGEGEEGEGGTNGESNMETHATISKIDNQWEFAGWLRELKPELCDNLEGWDAVGSGREVQKGGDIGIPMADSCWCMAGTNTIFKAIIFQLNITPFKRKNSEKNKKSFA